MPAKHNLFDSSPAVDQLGKFGKPAESQLVWLRKASLRQAELQPECGEETADRRLTRKRQELQVADVLSWAVRVWRQHSLDCPGAYAVGSHQSLSLRPPRAGSEMLSSPVST